MLLLLITDIPFYLAIGFAASIIGALPFGLVNLSVLQSAVNKGTRATLLVSTGASVVEIGYGTVGIFAGSLIATHINGSPWFHLLSALILLAVGVTFLLKKSKFHFSANNTFGGFWYGVLLNLLSLQVLIYWIIALSLLSSSDLLPLSLTAILSFLTGIGIGKMSVLYAYATLGEEIIGKSEKIARNINRLVGIILMGVALAVIIKGVI